MRRILRKRHVTKQVLEQMVKERTEELERANERLFLANRVKAEFLAHMSKDLRTPLNIILDNAFMQRDGEHGPVTADQLRSLDAIIDSGNRLLSFFDRILTLCNTEVGVTSFLPRDVSVHEIFASILDKLAPLFISHGVTVESAIRGEVGLVSADEAKLGFVVEELLTNAVKFSPHGSRVVLSAREVLVGEQRFLEVSVSDQGRGIRTEDIEKIFLGFEQGGGNGATKGAMGLGLALVKRFIDLHSGRIWVSSEPGEGSTFIFLLPCEGPSVVEQTHPRVMICDQEENFVMMLSHYLKEEGCQVLAAREGLDVIQKAMDDPPDLFILGIDLAGISGIDICLRFKADIKTMHVPVILVGDEGAEDDRVRSAQVGSDGFFVKPVELNELIPKVRSLVTQKINYDFLKKSYEAAELQACTDALTGLCNLRHLMFTLERELERSRRYGRDCSLAMIDIDYFKNYNDAHGHLAGDEVLKETAAVFRRNIRNSDIAARYGGEEFVVIMPETGRKVAERVGEKLRQVFEDHEFRHEETQPGGKLTISMGIATFPGDAATPRELLDKADKALYQAKETGRNRLVVWSGE
jgi:diguanylate cyclase (GGDEF)-like protein